MTIEGQDVLTDFYAGNYKELSDTIVDKDGNPFDLTGAEITYSIFTDDGNVVLTKTSASGSDQIEIQSPPTAGVCLIKLYPHETLYLNGTYRHHVNVVDVNGDEETVTTGRIAIFKSFARRPRQSFVPAYMEGA